MSEEAILKVQSSPAVFNIEKSGISSRYIAWIDLMGAANLMQFSLKSAAILLGKLHDVIFKTWKEDSARLTIHSVVDGCYVVASEIIPLLHFVENVMSRYFACFYKEYQTHCKKRAIWKYCALLRGAITYGPIYSNEDMKKGFKCDKNITPEELRCAYFSNIFVGNLLARAYELEKKAPPFGVYLDSSVVCQNLSLQADEQAKFILGQGAWYRWFLNSATGDCRNQLGIPQLPKDMGTAVTQFLEAERSCQYECNYPVERHDEWVKMVDEYFVDTNQQI